MELNFAILFKANLVSYIESLLQLIRGISVNRPTPRTQVQWGSENHSLGVREKFFLMSTALPLSHHGWIREKFQGYARGTHEIG